MTARVYRTATGNVLTEADLDAIADDVEHRGYDIEGLKSRRRGSPFDGGRWRWPRFGSILS